MNKKIISAILVTSSIMTATAVMADDAIKVTVNNVDVEFDSQPFIENNRTLVPMRAIFEALGADVAWDGENKTVISYDPKNDISITLQPDSNIMFVNDKAITIDVAAKIVNDRTYVPLRAISESLNSDVVWDGTTKTVTITSKN